MRRTRNPDSLATCTAAWIPGSRENARPGMTTPGAARCRSDLGVVEQEHVDAAGREFWQVGGAGQPFRAREGLLDRCRVVEMEQRHQVHTRRTRGRGHLAFAD